MCSRAECPRPLLRWGLAALLPLLGACAPGGRTGSEVERAKLDEMVAALEEKEAAAMTRDENSVTSETATFGAGCFWCSEAVLERVDGVLDVRSGYMGGSVAEPSYEQVCSGSSGHAEVVQVSFDPERLSYEQLLAWFWRLHDPTTLNRQGSDVGTQYRSVIFVHSDEQRRTAEASKQEADASGAFANPIVTEISPAATFYGAEDQHQDYYRLNKRQPYCRAIIAPKLDKLGLDQ